VPRTSNCARPALQRGHRGGAAQAPARSARSASRTVAFDHRVFGDSGIAPTTPHGVAILGNPADTGGERGSGAILAGSVSAFEQRPFPCVGTHACPLRITSASS
jgi:hypothetical protein